MRADDMQPLGGIDALFLHLETADTPMHVGPAVFSLRWKGSRIDMTTIASVMP